jgi:hypothetical protein
MEYAMWYQEHLLQMESILGKKIEAKIDEIIDMKFNEYIDIEIPVVFITIHLHSDGLAVSWLP